MKMSSWIEYSVSKWRDLNIDKLEFDEAYLRLVSKLEHKFWVYSLSEECYSCPYTKLEEVRAAESKVVKLNIAQKFSFKIFDKYVGTYAFNNETSYCEKPLVTLGEFGVYNMTVFSNKTCDIAMDKAPVNIYLPMLLVFLIVLAAVAVLNTAIFAWRRYNSRQRGDENTNTNGSDETVPATPNKRLKSLDTVRGIAIVLMIFVNSGGGKYWWIEHAPWNGLHFADMVFPLFIWIMGVCIPISVKSQLNRNISKRNILYNIFIRSVKLFLIGLFLNSANGPNLETVRIMGVLQRFGICYFCAASLYTIFSKQQGILPQAKLKRYFYDIFLMIPQWTFAWILVVIHLILTFGLPVPGCPKGYLGPGGKHSMAAYSKCIGGASGYIDELILGAHIYQHPTAKYIYDTKAFDPEGIFGSLLSIVQVLIGVQCGVTLITYSEWRFRVKRWIVWCLVLGIIGGILCQFSRENGWIPINKNLWSLSFVLVTSSLSFFLLTICYFMIDVKNCMSGAPLLYCGMNAIIMYIGHSVLHKILPWHWRIGLMNTHFVLLLECTWNTIIWVCIAYYLYIKKIFYSV